MSSTPSLWSAHTTMCCPLPYYYTIVALRWVNGKTHVQIIEGPRVRIPRPKRGKIAAGDKVVVVGVRTRVVWSVYQTPPAGRLG